MGEFGTGKKAAVVAGEKKAVTEVIEGFHQALTQYGDEVFPKSCDACLKEGLLSDGIAQSDVDTFREAFELCVNALTWFEEFAVGDRNIGPEILEPGFQWPPLSDDQQQEADSGFSGALTPFLNIAIVVCGWNLGEEEIKAMLGRMARNSITGSPESDQDARRLFESFYRSMRCHSWPSTRALVSQ